MLIRKTKNGFVTDAFEKQQKQQEQKKPIHKKNQNINIKNNNNNKRNRRGQKKDAKNSDQDQIENKHGMTVSKKFKKTERIIDTNEAISMGLDTSKGIAGDNDNYLTDCVFFIQNRCTKGDQCEFRHSDNAKKNPAVCKYWMKGTCHVLECIYRHPTRSTPVCSFYQQGTCNKGDSCPFLHIGSKKPNSGPLPSTSTNAAPVASTSPNAAPALATIVEEGEERESSTEMFSAEDFAEDHETAVTWRPKETTTTTTAATRTTVAKSTPSTKEKTTNVRSSPKVATGTKPATRVATVPTSTSSGKIQARQTTKSSPSSSSAASKNTKNTRSAVVEKSSADDNNNNDNNKKKKKTNNDNDLDFEQEMARIDELLEDEE